MRARLCRRCNAIATRRGYCEQHAGSKANHSRKTTDRGYGWDWQQFRETVLSARPVCEDCKENGMVTAATELHHIRKIVDAPHLRLDPRNVMALCGPCHDTRSRRGE